MSLSSPQAPSSLLTSPRLSPSCSSAAIMPLLQVFDNPNEFQCPATSSVGRRGREQTKWRLARRSFSCKTFCCGSLAATFPPSRDHKSEMCLKAPRTAKGAFSLPRWRWTIRQVPADRQVQQRQIGGGTLPTEKDVYNKLRIRKGIRQVFKQHPTIYDRGTLREIFSIRQETGTGYDRC